MNEWSLVYEDYVPEQEGLREALCTLGNGVFATRGAAPEATADDFHYPGTYAAGVYNRLVSEVDGLALEHESMVNLPNWLPLSFRPAEGEWLDLDAMEQLAHEHSLDVRRGLLVRKFRVADAQGRRTAVEELRLVHMADPHFAALEWTITAENWSGEIEVRAGIDAAVENRNVADERSLEGRHLVTVDRGASGGAEGIQPLGHIAQGIAQLVTQALPELPGGAWFTIEDQLL